MTVTMKASPSPIATSLRRDFSMTMSLRYSVEEDNSSEVMSRIIAMTASQRLMSGIDRGKFKFLTFHYAVPGLNRLAVRRYLVFLDSDDFASCFGYGTCYCAY